MDSKKIKDLRKILIMTSSFPSCPGSNVGGGGFVLTLAEKMNRFYPQLILAPKFIDSQEVEIVSNIKIFHFGFLPFKKLYHYFENGIYSGFKKNIMFLFIPFYLMSQIITSYKLIKKHSIRVLHCHWIIPQGISAFLLKKILRKRKLILIITVHGSDWLKENHYILKFLKLKILQNCDHVVTVSQFLADDIANNRIVNKISIIPMGIDTELFNQNKKDNLLRNTYQAESKIIVSAGRLTEGKGFQILIRAFSLYLEKDVKAKLIIAGSGEFQSDLFKLVKNLNISNNVIFLGYIDHEQLSELYASCDLCVFPSLSEGLGLAIGEAMSCGAVVIASDLPSIKDLINNGINGFTVPSNDVNGLYEKILQVFNNEQNMTSVRVAAREHIIKNFSWDIVVDKYLTIYRNYI